MGSWEVEETALKEPQAAKTFIHPYTGMHCQEPRHTQAAHNHAQAHTQTGTHAYRQTHGQVDEGKDLGLQPQGHIIQNPTKVMLCQK